MRLVYLIFGVHSLFFGSLFAHEGHVHEEPKPAAPAIQSDQTVTHEALTETVELVFKHPVFESGKATSSRLFLSTTDENRPISNASVEFEFAELDGLKIKFAPEKEHPGIYSANISFPKPGIFEATVSISAKNINDLLALSGIEVKPVLTGATPLRIPNIYLWAGFAALFFGTLIVMMITRRRKHA